MGAAETTTYLCTRCGDCCRWPGYVRVADDEVAAIADHLGLPVEAFTADHTRLTHDRTGSSSRMPA
jgi:RNA polymerase subunit RPABC4/transcription elongation factor Spt4